MEQANTKTPAGAMTTDLRALCARMAAELDHCRQLLSDDRRELHPLAVEARAALAQPEPEVVGPSDEELADTYWDAWHKHFDRTNSVLHSVGLRAVLSRWGRPAPAPAGERQAAPVPVAVSERLPGAEDCDAEGYCWWFSPADPSAGTFGVAACWVLRKCEPEDDFRSHWLPAHALPLPNGEVA